MEKLFNKLSKWMCGIPSDKYALLLCSLVIAFGCGLFLHLFTEYVGLSMSKLGASFLRFGISYIVGIAKEKINERQGGMFDVRNLSFYIIGACMGAVLFLI